MFPQRTQSDIFNMLPLNPYNKRKLYEELQATSTYFDEKPKCKFIEIKEEASQALEHPSMEDQLQTDLSSPCKKLETPLQSETLETEQLGP